MAKAISYHATVKDLQGLPFAETGPFDRLDWFELLERSSRERSGPRPLIALARGENGAIALPLAQARKGVESLANWYAFTWQPLVTPGADQAALLVLLARDMIRRHTRLTIGKLPGEDGTATGLAAAFRRAGWITALELCDINRFVETSGIGYREWLATRPGPLRTTLKRKARKLDVELITRYQSDIWNIYESIYAESWKPEEGDPAFLRRFAQAEGAAGRLRLAIAYHGGEPVAVQFWTVERGTAYIHKLAHRPSATALSPGTVLTAALMEHVLDRDHVNSVDFGTGDDRYKRDWMDHTRPRYRLTCWRPAHPGNWPAIGKAVLRKLVSRRGAG